MQQDMHFYGTYVIARCAGLPHGDAHTMAYAAQFVDDSTQQDSEKHRDGGMLYGIATAHHPARTVWNRAIEPEEQRRVWVPFHFFPGGRGDTLEEKLICVRDGQLLRTMMERHLKIVKDEKPPFGMELLGIAAHAYLDSFAHYDFSGISSPYNEVKGNSFKFFELNSSEEAEERSRGQRFLDKFREEKDQIVSFLAESASNALGHGSVMTYPDHSHLHWSVIFEKDRPGNGPVSDRSNPDTYMEGCEKFYAFLSAFADRYYTGRPSRSFDEVRNAFHDRIMSKGTKDERLQQWRQAIDGSAFFQKENGERTPIYSPDTWEDEKKQFHQLSSSEEGTKLHAYRFHQAAALHRYYVLKNLLPAHGIAVY